MKNFVVFSFHSDATAVACTIQNQLRKNIDKADLLIPSATIAKDLTLKTLNQKHFKNIDDLRFVTTR